MKNQKEKLISLGDIILFAAIMVISVVAGIVIINNRKEGLNVEISLDGEVVKIMELSDDEQEYLVNTDNGTNLIKISKGVVTVSEADCPDKVCVNHKPISLTGETIICLPHKLVIEIVD